MRRQALLLGLSLSLGAWAQQVYQALPSDDVWLYDNAFNPGFTPILRVWGNGQDAVDPINPARPRSEFSYALAKWLLQGIPAGRQYQVLQAQITVVQTQPPGYTRAEGEQFPLEARDLSDTSFVEATWSYNTNTTSPGATIFGESLMTNYRTDAPFAIPIPLNAEAFEPYFNAAVNQNGGGSSRMPRRSACTSSAALMPNVVCARHTRTLRVAPIFWWNSSHDYAH